MELHFIGLDSISWWVPADLGRKKINSWYTAELQFSLIYCTKRKWRFQHSSDPQTLTFNWRELTYNASLSQLFDSLGENTNVFRSLSLFPCLSSMSAYRHIHTHRTTTPSIYHYILSRKCSYLENKCVWGDLKCKAYTTCLQTRLFVGLPL